MSTPRHDLLLGALLGALLGLICLGCETPNSADVVVHVPDARRPDAQSLDAQAPDAQILDAQAPDARLEDALPNTNADSSEVAADGGSAIDSCPAACDRLATCGRLEALYPDQPTCELSCLRASRVEAPDAYFQCLEEEICGLVHLCPLPDPSPLDAVEIAGLLTECGLVLPRWASAAAVVTACAQRLVGACEVRAFSLCVAEGAARHCRSRCDGQLPCVADCVGGCVAESFAADPLTAERAAARSACVVRADGCAGTTACLDPIAPSPVADDAQTFCRLWDACGHDRILSCALALDEGAGHPWFLRCAVTALSADCAEDGLDLQRRCVAQQVPGPTCRDLCVARRICESLGGETEAECTNGCAANLADPEAMRRTSATVNCGRASSCADLDRCEAAANPVSACGNTCAVRQACGAASPDCEAVCLTRFDSQRHTAFRACVSTNRDDCEAVERCPLSNAEGCVERCEAVERCGAADTCLRACDDQQFVNANAALLQTACVLSADTCREPGSPYAVDACPSAGGASCYAWCRTQTECVGAGPEAMLACLQSCAQLEGSPLAERLAGSPCLIETGPFAACQPLLACLSAVDRMHTVRCDQGALVVPSLAARCEADLLARARLGAVGRCLDGASGPLEIGACLAVEVPTEDAVARVNFCRALADSGLAGPCDPLWDRLVGLGIEGCAMQRLDAGGLARSDELLSECLEGPAPGAAPPPTAQLCRMVCDARAVCGRLDGATRIACRARCAAAFSNGAEDAGALRPELDCATALSCQALDACLEMRSAPAECARWCARRQACDPSIDPARCQLLCAARFGRLRDRTARRCAEAAPDCEALTVCEPAAPPPCADACARINQCELAPPADLELACVARCDDGHMLDPEAIERQVECVLSAPSCRGRGDTFGVSDCL